MRVSLPPKRFISSYRLYNVIMRKTLIISITAALLLCAVLCTAGCVEAPSDPIVGTYVSETDSSVSYAVFEEGGTGHIAEAAAGETDKDSWVLTGTCSWAAADSKGTYTLTFADGRVVTAVLNAEHGLMTIGEVEYQKYPSGYSGTAGELRANQEVTVEQWMNIVQTESAEVPKKDQN